MLLKKVKYRLFPNTNKEWTLLDFSPQPINLIVGKNAAGKTKSLSSISTLAHLLSGERTELPRNVFFEFTWLKSNVEICYTLKCLDRKVIFEKLVIDGDVKLERKQNSPSKMYFAELGMTIATQVPENHLCTVARRDTLQHPYFEELHTWATSTLHYRFGSVFGKNTGLLIKPEDERNSLNDIEIDLRKTDNVVELFRQGFELYGDIFVNNIIADMNKISYELSDINIGYSPNMKFKSASETPPVVLRVKEKDLSCYTYQAHMSQGMFRALSLVIQLNLSKLQSQPTCIIIDDIGEGLDFSRATQLIRLLVESIEETSIQLFMSTNGRFTMNNVSLKYWSIIQRQGHESKIFNYANSREAFEEFIFTGLSNFDFLSSGFYCKELDDNE
ncbi:MAG: ATP-binding protein [Lentisphaeraceae bacterium]|nr:ATP-binding protein [Lentisphaeraceae bacterium]